MLGSLWGVDSLVSHVTADGQAHYFKESTGSMSGQDEYLAFPMVFLLPLLLRLFRPTARLDLVEMALHLLSLGLIGIAVGSVGLETLRQTQRYEDSASLFFAFKSGIATCLLSLLLLLDRLLSHFWVPRKSKPRE